MYHMPGAEPESYGLFRDLGRGALAHSAGQAGGSQRIWPLLQFIFKPKDDVKQIARRLTLKTLKWQALFLLASTRCSSYGDKDHNWLSAFTEDRRRDRS